ncbi:MAG TPA: hypothetical protein DCS11_03435 [Syntrophus sp. (in: bacteria)]|nr:hypothetical protein [Syntrophus sp. (in: bacteria)]
MTRHPRQLSPAGRPNCHRANDSSFLASAPAGRSGPRHRPGPAPAPRRRTRPPGRRRRRSPRGRRRPALRPVRRCP